MEDFLRSLTVEQLEGLRRQLLETDLRRTGPGRLVVSPGLFRRLLKP